MQINSVAPQTQSGETNTPSTTLDGNSFLILLVAQLRSQDPFSPMNPVEFVNQLVQFNMLEQTIRIREALESASGGSNASQAIPQTSKKS